MAVKEILGTLASSTRPLIISDVDEVVLEFLDPFQAYLASVEHRLHADSFRLHGNIRRLADQAPASSDEIRTFQEAFFASQEQWQTPAKGAYDVLASLSESADIVLLTAMPPRHHDRRRALLDSHGLNFPMIATEDAKGPVVAELIGSRSVPAVFIDDIASNLASVRTHAPDCMLIHLMANATFRALAPDPGNQVARPADWNEADALIRAHFGIAG
jgi:hypothetical protein